VFFRIILVTILQYAEAEVHRAVVMKNSTFWGITPCSPLKLHNEELHNLYSSRSIIRMAKSSMKWGGRVARMGKKRIAHKILVGKPEGKRPLGRPRLR
jgi:hypothetical protein